MDTTTLAAYDANAAGYAADWLAQAPPEDMYALLREHFAPGPTLDVGCGAGRDTAWLAANGFEARGVDASPGLLAQACLAHPALRFDLAALPELAGVERAAFQNVLCETVVMHLEPVQVGPSVRSLLALLRPGGTLYLSWRVTDDVSIRDPAGRLYAAFDKAVVMHELAPGDAIVHDEERVSVSSGKRVQRLVARRAAAPRDVSSARCAAGGLVHPRRRCRMAGQLAGGADRSPDQFAAAVRASIRQPPRAGRAEGALEGADPRVDGVGRQVDVAAFATGFEQEHRTSSGKRTRVWRLRE